MTKLQKTKHMQLDGIKNIIFDLGRVLLNLDFEASIKAFHKMGLDQSMLDPKMAYADPVFYELETGKISPKEFRERVRILLNNNSLTDQQIDDAWYAMILDIPKKRVEMLQKLSENYRVFLFSNTNQIHIDRLLVDFKAAHGIEFESLFEKAYYSHEIHDRKPLVSSFEKVIQLAGINPEESLFIDDLEKNIEGAKTAGLKAFWLKPEMEICELL